MGEYEDRYPDAYGRDEAPVPPAPGSPAEDRKETPPRQGRDRFSLRGLLQAGGAPPPAWQHGPSEAAPTTIPAAPRPPGRDCRGIGPRGYVRSSTRIYEDICDRLTDHPLIDASDIEVVIGGIEVTLRGSVDNAAAARHAEAIARAVPGVKTVRNTLTVRTDNQASQR